MLILEKIIFTAADGYKFFGLRYGLALNTVQCVSLGMFLH